MFASAKTIAGSMGCHSGDFEHFNIAGVQPLHRRENVFPREESVLGVKGANSPGFIEVG
jgi:hypothetical protein